MKFKKHSILCIIYALCSGFSYANNLDSVDSVDLVLTQLPQIRAADAAITAAQANAERLRVGTYEWSVKAAAQQRREVATGMQYPEYEIGIEKPMRWLGKAETDAQLGEIGIRIAQLTREKTLYEARRTFITEWLDALRESRIAQILTEQAQLSFEQLEVVKKRVKAGESAPLDAISAQADHARTGAASLQAQARADTLMRALHRRYPNLPKFSPLDLPTLTPPAMPDAASIAARLAKHPAFVLAQTQAQQAQLRATRAEQERTTDPTWGIRAVSERDGQEKILGIYVSIPIGGAGRKADSSQAQAERESAQHQLEQTRKEVEAQLWHSAESTLQSYAAWQRLEAVRTLVQRSTDLQVRAYGLGEAILHDTLQARRLVLEAHLAAETVRMEAVAARMLSKDAE
ncbi:MAG: hypothetical protein RIR79_1634 [Pseudomonadota bacterium]|jgi:outer membrane protein TolC